MKKAFIGKLKSITLIVAITGLLTACNKQMDEPVITPPLNDNSLPSAAIANAILLQKSDKSLQFELDVAVFKDSKNMETTLDQSNFSIDTLDSYGETYTFKLNSVSLSNAQNSIFYSALMLMDQSGSISSTDPDNYRIDAGKAFCSGLENGSDILLWSFSDYNYQQYGTGFTTDTAAVIQQIENLRNKEGGGTPLYSSQIAATNYTAANGTNPGKAVLTFTDGEDTNGGTPEDVVNNAKKQNVRLFNMGLGNAQTELLFREAVASGGAFMYAQDARQLISAFGNLGKLLDQSARYYHTTWTVTSSSSAFSSGGSLSYEMTITLPYDGDVIMVPFTIDY